ncbi:RDD family protein [Alteromonas gilva]|uniref:RDD family protein n=1 Tax=Alteromonas gilva TaxID=2987522 RepID=A0ABT5L3V6_9ALTE|nr:RDD family protein [Alteromonas gilva]MDC8831191.1 RDD family protein [Alteromonas gilva]
MPGVATTSQPDAAETETLTSKETRERVTPYAFGVADELLGQPLASPWRRLFAQCIDVSIVVLLSTAHALILAVFVAVTFFRAGKHLADSHKKRGFARKSLRFTGALLLFFVTYTIVDSSHFDSDSEPLGDKPQYITAGLQVAQKYAWQSCNGDMDCYEEVASGFAKAFADTEMTAEEATQKFQSFLDDEGLTAGQSEYLLDIYTTTLAANMPVTESQEQPSSRTAPNIEESVTNPPEPAIKIGLGSENDTSRSQSLISWVQGIISDLGLGFGWAALYYSVLSAWWGGHTIGKKLLRVKVVKLDGTLPNLWESFGRYGGYTAGFATGLLGFLQIFWDPNRQTIQDKIAETLVLYRPVGSTPIAQLINHEESDTTAEQALAATVAVPDRLPKN